MNFLFRFFLFFCSRDFASYYADLRRNNLVNKGALLGVIVRYLVYMTLYSFVGGILIYHMSDFFQKIQGVIGASIAVIFVVFLFCYERIKSLEDVIFAYSDGVLVEAVLVDIIQGKEAVERDMKTSKKGIKHKYVFEVEGRKRTLTTRVNIFTMWGVDLGHKVLVIYARTTPHFARFYKTSHFPRYCLDKSKTLSSLEDQGTKLISDGLRSGNS